MRLYISLLIILILLIIDYNFISYEMFDNQLGLVPGLYVDAANKLGIPVKIHYNYRGRVTIGGHEKNVLINQLYNSFNDNNSLRLAKDKFKTFLLLNKNKIPVPKAQLFKDIKNKSKNDIVRNIDNSFPLVVKQVSGANGTHVYVDINSQDELNKTLDEISSVRDEIMIEKFIKGNDYRILVFDGKVIDIINRPQPFIKGDGVSSLRKIIDRENSESVKNNKHNIIIDKAFLKKKGIRLSDIPDKNKKIVVNPLTNFHQGSIPKRIPLNKCHQDNIKLFEKTAKLMNLKMCGIDFLTPNIGESYKKVTSAINEVNGLPNLDIHYYSDKKNDSNIAVKILESYFKS